jgi:hypothetical protein
MTVHQPEVPFFCTLENVCSMTTKVRDMIGNDILHDTMARLRLDAGAWEHAPREIQRAPLFLTRKLSCEESK